MRPDGRCRVRWRSDRAGILIGGPRKAEKMTMTETTETDETIKSPSATAIIADLDAGCAKINRGLRRCYCDYMRMYGVDPLALSAASRRVARASEDAGAGYDVTTFIHDDFEDMLLPLIHEERDEILEIVLGISAAHAHLSYACDLARKQVVVQITTPECKIGPPLRPGGMSESIAANPIWI